MTKSEKSIVHVIDDLRKEEEAQKTPSISETFFVDLDAMRRRHVLQLEKEEAEAAVAEEQELAARIRAQEARQRAYECTEAIKRIDGMRDAQ